MLTVIAKHKYSRDGADEDKGAYLEAHADVVARVCNGEVVICHKQSRDER